MTNVRVVPPPHPDDHTKREAGGAICPLCRACADAGVPHLCITSSILIDQILDLLNIDVLDQLANHPARPWTSGDLTTRAVDRTWCDCQHQPPGTATTGPGQARS